MGCVKERKENEGVCQDEVYRACLGIDSFIAKELAESIVVGTSYDMLEAHYGILPISRRSFYRRRSTVQRLMRQRGMRYIEERNGQLRMVFHGNRLI